jgi:hypothetical protein
MRPSGSPVLKLKAAPQPEVAKARLRRVRTIRTNNLRMACVPSLLVRMAETEATNATMV